MRTIWLSCVLAAAFVCGNAKVTFAQDVLVISPDAGASPVGTPQNLVYGAGALLVTGNLSGIDISSPVGLTPFWGLTVRPVSGEQLAVGCFERARRFGSPTRPEIDFGFGGSGCNRAYGRFKVLELQTNKGGAITSLAVDFAQQCERFGKAVLGKVRFNSAVPTDGNFHDPVLSSTGSLSFTAASGAIGSTAPGGMGNISLSRVNTLPSINFDNGASFSYNGALPGGGSGSWSLNFASAGDQALVVGAYPIATRYPFQAANEAGLDFSYSGAGCNTLVGSFDVSNVRYDGLDPVVTDFSATFSQRCPGAQGPLTTGSVNFDGTIIGPTSFYGEGVVFRSGFESGERPTFFSATCE